MSQWNSTYAYNGQYQAGNAWNGDLNGQYVNQSYYPNRQDPSGQYVSFNDFLSQMQSSNTAPNNLQPFPNVPYENYASAQYNYQNMPSTSQEPQLENYNYNTNTSTTPNNSHSYHVNVQRQYNVNPPYPNDLILKSNLTPTANEFVPKSLLKPSSSNQNISEAGNFCNGVHEPVNDPGSSSNSNWRERTQNSHKSGETNGKESSSTKSHRSNRNHEGGGRNRDFNYSDNKNNELYHETYRNNESRSRKNDSSSRYDTPRSESISQNQETNYQNSEDRSYNSSGRNDRRGQSKSNNKQRVKDSDVRTFYNSSVPKDSQDVRNSRNEGRQKNWTGTQRPRGVDRNNPDDEQYANSYIHQRDDKSERMKTENASTPTRFRNKNVDQAHKEMTQRERLTEQLDKGTLECLVCCDRVKQIDPVWSCGNCYHVLHLKCIRKWAQSSTVEGKWRCPACQNLNEEIPTEYRCMCGAMRSPEYQRGSTSAHTCGKACKRPRACPHPCTLLCHPGPCPPCQATVNKQCGCGAETRSILCSSKLPQVCGRVCQRTLECNVHKCTKECHEGPCDTCEETVTQVCYCGAARSRKVPCTAESSARTRWQCGAECARVLACGAHVCRAPCHAPPCAPCALLPDRVLTCPCGKTKVERDKRKSCTDPIPLCGNICAKPLQCGPAGDKHFCKLNCHEGPCPVCPDKTLLQCRCGHSSREVPCADLPEMLNNVLCQKKCNKKLSCGRHKCRSVCCASSTHRCGVVCGRALSCQLHRCEEFCHTGRCAPCPRLSFDELHCECGAEVLLPPVRCGARPPACSAACPRERACLHPPHHSCHSGDCPPCVVLTTKRCHGNHEERKTIPCSQEEFSCGLPCGKPLPCGKHNCIKTCHKGECDTGKCTQPCTEKRPGCGHPCAAPCHAGAAAGSAAAACPSAAPCRRAVRATCACGRRAAERACCDNARDYDRYDTHPTHPCAAAGSAAAACPSAAPCRRAVRATCACGRRAAERACCDNARDYDRYDTHPTHPCAAAGSAAAACPSAAPCRRAVRATCACGRRAAERACCDNARDYDRYDTHPTHPCAAAGSAAAACPSAAPCRRAVRATCACGRRAAERACCDNARDYDRYDTHPTHPCAAAGSAAAACPSAAPCRRAVRATCACGRRAAERACCDNARDYDRYDTHPTHPCAAAGSAAAACPSAAPCRRAVRATCACGRRAAERACCDNARDYDRMVSALAATKMQDGGSVDLADVHRPTNVLKTLECEEECRAEARARRLALALQLRNPDVSSKLAPRYSEHVRATAQREPAFALHVHDKLTELVQRAKKSKQKTRSHSFPSMNWQKRQFIHEMCEHFGCESVAYDAEPNRNVVATADREKSWLPAMSVLEVLAREAGKRRVPPPVLRAAPAAGNNKSSGSGWATLTSNNAWAARSQQKPPAPQTDAKVDYFDNPPDN